MKWLSYAVGFCLVPISAPAGRADLVVNGDFGAGNTGFASSYAFVGAL